MTPTLFRIGPLQIAAALISGPLFLGFACSDDGSGPTYSVPAAAGAAGTINRGSGTLLPEPPGGVPAVNNGTGGTPGLGLAGTAGTGGLPGTGGAPGFATGGSAGSLGYASGGVAGTPDIGSAGVAGTFGLAGMGGESDLLP